MSINDAAQGAHATISLTQLRQQVVALLSEVLNEPFDDDSEFFDSGGSSLQAEQVMLRLAQLYPPGLTIRQFYESPTADGIARALYGAGEPRSDGRPTDTSHPVIPSSR